jgi:hypothetical protein
MDSSTKVDDYLYKSKSSRKVTRVIEFLVFGFLVLWFYISTAFFFTIVDQILRTLFWMNLVLMIFVLLRLIITKKLSAYITLFFLFTYFYALFILFDLVYGLLSTASVDPIHVIVSFVIDAALFAYIIGTVYEKTEYIQDKIKLFRVDTIALFLITMKIYVQVTRIGVSTVPVDVQVLQAQLLFIIFVFFNLIFGIYSIFAHKSKKSKR